MVKYRNKKRAKLNTLKDELKRLQNLDYYHLIEDIEDIKSKINLIEKDL